MIIDFQPFPEGEVTVLTVVDVSEIMVAGATGGAARRILLIPVWHGEDLYLSSIQVFTGFPGARLLFTVSVA